MEVSLNGKPEGYVLNGMLWTPDDDVPVKYVIQVVHGMTEHIRRYEKFAKFLTERGFVVAGYDLRGHGANDGDAEVASFVSGTIPCKDLKSSMAFGWDASVNEVYKIHKELLHLYPLAKHYMMGFSLGSFLVRDFMEQKIVLSLDGIILAGTGYQSPLITGMMGGLVMGEVKKVGFGQTTDLVRNLAFGTYNKKFTPTRTRADWLCSDSEELEMYLCDPFVRKDISAELFHELLRAMGRTSRRSAYQHRNGVEDMPVLLLSGENDPVGNFGKGVKTLECTMKSAGMRRVESAIYAGARHDIFHEYSNGVANKVMNKICGWAERNNRV